MCRREQERKNQGEGILDEQELRKGQRFAKMLNEHQTRPDNNVSFFIFNLTLSILSLSITLFLVTPEVV